MPISQRLYERLGQLLLALGTAALALVCVASVWMVQDNHAYAESVSHSQDVLTRIARLRWQLRTTESSQRGYLLTDDAKYLASYETARVEAVGSIEKLGLLLRDSPDETMRVAQVQSLSEKKLEEIAGTIASAKAGARDEALAIVNSDAGLKLMNDIDGVLDGMVAIETKIHLQQDQDYDRSNEAVLILALVGTLLTVLLGGGFWWMTRRYVEELRVAHASLGTANATLERRVEERTAALQEANEEVQRFAYIVSHDLRSPLVNIMGFTSELEAALGTLRALVARLTERNDGSLELAERLAVEDDLPEAIGFIRASTLKMDRLIKAILQLSREGARILAPESVNVGEVARAAAASLKTMCDQRGAEIIIERVPAVVSDRLAVEQILSNLMENAVKYLSPGRPGRIVVSGRNAGHMVEISVADNGRGIDPKDRERVFELFRRAGTQDQQGEGIGLAHVRALARRLGGTVTVRSELGVGSTFTLSLPITGLSKGAATA